MSKTNKQKFGAGLEGFNEPRLDGWNPNTDLGCDLKTILRSDRRMQTSKDYQGVLRRDSDADVDEFLCRDAHYTFIEQYLRSLASAIRVCSTDSTSPSPAVATAACGLTSNL